MTANRRNRRLASRSRPRRHASQNTTTTSAISNPIPIMIWYEQCVMLTGGQSDLATESSPEMVPSKEPGKHERDW